MPSAGAGLTEGKGISHYIKVLLQIVVVNVLLIKYYSFIVFRAVLIRSTHLSILILAGRSFIPYRTRATDKSCWFRYSRPLEPMISRLVAITSKPNCAVVRPPGIEKSAAPPQFFILFSDKTLSSRCQRKISQSKAEDAGILTDSEEDNAAMRNLTRQM